MKISLLVEWVDLFFCHSFSPSNVLWFSDVLETRPPQPRELLECWINSLQVQPLPLWVLSDSSSFQPWVFGFCPDPSCRKTFVFPLVLSLYFIIKYQLWCCLQMHNPNLLQISLRPETPGMQQWVDVIPSPNSFSSFSSLGIYSAVIGT